MTVALTHITLLLVTFILGFRTGKKYIVKGLTLRIEQLFAEGKYQDARLYKKVLEEDEKETNQ